MFAFALHDSAKDRLYLTRDHIGIKPLYYAFTNKYIVWGSEMKALLASGLVERELELEGLGQFLAWEYVPGKDMLLKGVKKLEPAQMIEILLEGPTCKPWSYWDVPNNRINLSFSPEEWEDAVDQKNEECVKRQLVSDVPLEAFLSGGVERRWRG